MGFGLGDFFGGGDQEVTQKSEPWGHLKPYLRDWVMPEALRMYQQGPMPFYPNQTFMPMTDMERMGLMNQGAFLGMPQGMFPDPGAPSGFTPVGAYQPAEGSYPPNMSSFVDPSGRERARHPIVPPPGGQPSGQPTGGGGGGRSTPPARGGGNYSSGPVHGTASEWWTPGKKWKGSIPQHPGAMPSNREDQGPWNRRNDRYNAYQDYLNYQNAPAPSVPATQRVTRGQYKMGAEPAASAYGGMMGGAQQRVLRQTPQQGGKQSRFGGGGLFGSLANAAGASPAQNLVNQTMGTSAGLMGAPDVGRNPWVQGAVDAGTRRMTQAFSENVLPELSRLALGRGMTGASGHTEGVLRGAEDLLQNIGDFQKGYMGDAYGRGLGAAGEAVRLSPQTFRMGLAPGAAMQDIGGQFRGEGQRYLDEDMRRYDWGYNAQNQHLNNLIAGLNPGLRFQSSTTNQPGAPLLPQLIGTSLGISALPWSKIGGLFGAGGGGGGVMSPGPMSAGGGWFNPQGRLGYQG